MELDLGDLKAHLKLDDSQYVAVLGRNLQTTNRELETMNQKVSAIGSTIRTAFGFAAGYLGIRALKNEITSLIGAARDAYEAENLFVVSMGQYEQAARSWSQELQRALGLSEYEARKNIGTYNVMLTSMGMSEEAAYEMSKSLVQLAYDMSSFYNLRPEDAFFKLQAAISGETEPLRRLGINIKAERMEEYALQQGWIQGKEKLSALGKTYATYGAIIESTTKAQGDLERTSSSAANMERRLQSELRSVKIELGMRLLPAYQHALSTASGYLQANLDDITSWANGTISATGAVIKAYAEAQNWFARFVEKQAAPGIIRKEALNRYLQEYPEDGNVSFGAMRHPDRYREIVAQLTAETNSVMKERDELRAKRLSGNYDAKPPEIEQIGMFPGVPGAHILPFPLYGEKDAADTFKYSVLQPDAGLDMTKGDSDKKQAESAQKAADAIADAAAERVRTTAAMYDQIGAYDEEWFQARMTQILLERRENEDKTNDAVTAEKWYTSQVSQLREEQVKKSQEAEEKRLAELEKQQQAAERVVQVNAQLYAGLEGTTGAYEAQVALLDHQRESYEKIGADVRAINAWYERQIELLEIVEGKNGNIAEQLHAAALELQNEAERAGGPWYQFAKELPSMLESGLVKMTQDTRNWADAAKQMLKEVYNEAIRIAFLQPIAQGMAGAFSSIGSAIFNSSTTVTAATPGTGGIHGFDEGGISYNRQLAWVSETEPEIHAPFSKAKELFGGGGKVTVNVINQDSGSLTVSRQEEYMMSDERIIDVFVSRAQTDSRLQRAMGTRR